MLGKKKYIWNDKHFQSEVPSNEMMVRHARQSIQLVCTEVEVVRPQKDSFRLVLCHTFITWIHVFLFKCRKLRLALKLMEIIFFCSIVCNSNSIELFLEKIYMKQLYYLYAQFPKRRKSFIKFLVNNLHFLLFFSRFKYSVTSMDGQAAQKFKT